MKKIILYYLYSILLISIIGRIIFGSLDNVSMHPGIIIHVAILALLIINFLKNKIKKNMLSFMILAFTLIYVVNLFVVEMIQFSNIPIARSLTYTLKIFLLLFLSDFIYKNAAYYKKYLNKILLINSVVLLFNIIVLGYVFQLGWQSYRIEGLGDSYRGFLAGNNTSIFAFISYGYALFLFSEAKLYRKKVFYGALLLTSLYAMFIIATKAMIIAIIITFLFSIRKGFNLKILVKGILILFIFISSILTIPALQDRIFKSYLNQKIKTIEKLDTSVIPESLIWLNEIAPGRTVIGLSLVIHLISDNPFNFLFGYGAAGIYEAFGRPPQMHLFSSLGHYGFLGWLFFYVPQLFVAVMVIIKRKITMASALFFVIFLYGTLGGFVFGVTSTSTLYALLFALTLNQLKLKKGFKE